MPKFSLDINGVSQGAAEGREAWAGDHPPTGTYQGVLKVVQVDKISDTAKVEANRGKPKLRIGVELKGTEGKYDGYLAWSNLNLIDSSIPYVNQFLISLTDGSDEQFATIKKAFYGGFVTDDRDIHVKSIGQWKINSPEGEIPVVVSLKKRSYVDNSGATQTISDINSFLLGGGGAKNTGAVKTQAPEEAPEEEASIELEPEDDGSVFADEETTSA